MQLELLLVLPLVSPKLLVKLDHNLLKKA